MFIFTLNINIIDFHFLVMIYISVTWLYMLRYLICTGYRMAQTQVICNKCGSTKNRKHGFAPNGIQRYWCRDCERVFQLEYVNHGSEPDIHERIIQLKMEGMGFRAIARTLKLSLPTVSKHLKKIKSQNAHAFHGDRKKTSDSAPA